MPIEKNIAVVRKYMELASVETTSSNYGKQACLLELVLVFVQIRANGQTV